MMCLLAEESELEPRSYDFPLDEVILHLVKEDVPLGVLVSYPGHYTAHRDHMTFYICPQSLLHPVLLYMWYDFYIFKKVDLSSSLLRCFRW